MKLFNSLILAGSFLGISLFAQDAKRNCGTMEYDAYLRANDPNYALNRQQIEEFTQQQIESGAMNKTSAVVTIPVVVHVVYKTSTENISDAQINSQIAVLNADFRRLNADASNTPSAFASAAVDAEFEFCLATTDPQGNPTTGITRTQTTVSSFSVNDAMKYTAQGGRDAWPRASYLNLWVCNLGGGILGYAQFPGTGGAATDGVVIGYNYFGTMGAAQAPFNKGRTATHEVGHWLNLNHIWGDDGGACSGSDNVSDTPNQADENYNCPTFPLTDACSSSYPGVMFMNYMDYVDDNCMNMFTAGQKARMQALFASSGARASLLNSAGCSGGTSCVGVATPITQNFQGTFPPSNYTISNPNSDFTWIKSTSAGYNSSSSMTIDNFNNQGVGNEDVFQLPPANLLGLSGVTLQFDVAYSAYQFSNGTVAWDSLAILISKDCGGSWSAPYKKGLATLPTTSVTTGNTGFTPTSSSQWRHESISLSNYISDGTLIKFKNISGYGNFLYIDNINVSGTATGIEDENQQEIVLFPNPAYDKCTIKLPEFGKYQVELLNLSGQKIQSQEVNAESLEMNLSEIARGIYFVRVNGKNGSSTQKLVVE